jgi:hypothetical protein
MLNVNAINWRLDAYSFSARAWLCPDCWAKYQPLLTDAERGTLLLQRKTSNAEARDRKIQFFTKGKDCVETHCTDCGCALEAAEEVWLYTS